MLATLKSLNLAEGGQPSLVVAPRTYEDSPQPQAPPNVRKASRSLGEDEIAVEPASHVGDFIFSDQTAARYKEFNVVKVNKRGVRQDRVLGIDRERFYNKTRSEDDAETSSLRNGLLKTVGLRQSASGTKHPEFNMRDLLSVQLLPQAAGGYSFERGKEFCCVFKDPEDPSKQKQYHYEAMSAHDAAEIVAKLDYLMNMQMQESSRTNSAPVPPSLHDQASRSYMVTQSNLSLGGAYLYRGDTHRGVALSRTGTGNV